MNDDFNTALAIAHIFDLSRKINKFIDSREGELTSFGFSILRSSLDVFKKLGDVLGFLAAAPDDFFKSLKETFISKSGIPHEEIEELIKKRGEARKEKKFSLADSIRKELEEKGIILEDTPSGTVWRSRESGVRS